MKVAVLLTLLLLSTFADPIPEKIEEIEEIIHDISHGSKMFWTGFQAKIHLQESWDLPQSCFGAGFEKDLYTVVMSLINIVEQPNPITDLIKLVTKGYEITSSLKKD
mmetsp:Transcript_31018/g.30564  ORF Transcript_31018/g.30564 Transcript_31018/m.30564 type:complete len:107 (+) Transcript_31018:26-346(+)|eukprot:CAMPEP_0197006368 /NCGR_PEP_ID=MMETSP1380-20130617/34609_1 /TAXON_ID=5936 /ORGANISM="Euplotes crassus, Strain CT5" /LENGTH=106 /DNA_ID=CAMNT_0042425925 /DNA_START=24 /DNA_END=344 /DNA_ORIENTATION=+